MRPSLLQYLVARWLIPLWFSAWTGSGVACGAILSLRVLMAFPAGVLNLLLIPFLAIYCILAGALGFFIGVLVGAIVLPPICWWRGWVNGAPFQVGDRVRILDGPHRDEVRTIYTVWDERGEVRLDFGPHAKEEFADTFSYLSVCREQQALKPAVKLPLKC
jgi:hypothetical protein